MPGHHLQVAATQGCTVGRKALEAGGGVGPGWVPQAWRWWGGAEVASVALPPSPVERIL